MKTFVAVLTVLTALFVSAGSAPADVGFVSSSRTAGAPGDRVELTIGCGFCFPSCVGEPGHRHASGDPHGACMLGDREGPPASFAVWLTSLRYSLDRQTCGPGEYKPGEPPRGPCRSGSRPPHLPSFIYLGRAMPPRASGESAEQPRHRVPRYRLIFGVPETSQGPYRYVLFCEPCVHGPRGTLIDGGTTAAGRLRVLPPIATAGDGGRGGAQPWIGLGALAAVLALGAGFLLHDGSGTRPRAGREA